MAGVPPSERPASDHESSLAAADLAVVTEAIRETVAGIRPLIDSIGQPRDPRLAEGGWTASAWRSPGGEYALDEENTQRTELNAGASSDRPGRDSRLLRGPAGEFLSAAVIFHRPEDEDDQPSEFWRMGGRSAEGEFSFSYSRRNQSGGVICTRPDGIYNFNFNIAGHAMLRITPLPLGQVTFGWDSGPHLAAEAGGSIKPDSRHVKLAFYDNPYPMGREAAVVPAADALDWYNGLNIEDKDTAQLGAWLEALPAVISLRGLVEQTRRQSGQAIAAIEAVIEDPSVGRLLTPEDYERVNQEHRTNPPRGPVSRPPRTTVLGAEPTAASQAASHRRVLHRFGRAARRGHRP